MDRSVLHSARPGKPRRAAGALLLCLAACGGGAPPQADASSGAPDTPAWPAAQPLEAPFDFGPWLTMPAPSRIAVSFRLTEEAEAEVRFRPEGGEERSLSSPPAVLHHVDLGALEPATSYHYEVEAGGALRRGVFTTPGLERWRFIHSAEFHAPSMSAFVSLSTEAIRAFRPQVLVASGDMLDDGDDLEHWRDYFRTSSPWISNVILLPVGSNHVQGPGGNANLRRLFVLPGNERWYATRYGAVQFLSLDSTYGSNPDITGEEPTWIAEQTAAAHDGTGDPEFLIAAWHYPACSSTYASRADLRDWVMDNFIAAFRAGGGLDLALVGHDKYYERSTLGGDILHLQANLGKLAPEEPGENREECAPIVTDTQTRSLPLFEVEPGRIRARVLDAERRQIDAFTLER